MHVDFSSGTAYTFSFEGPGGSRAEVVSVTAAGAVQVADITSAVAGGNVRPGQTTHCSATKHMYVGVDHGGAGKDQVLAVDLTKGAVDQTVTLQVRPRGCRRRRAPPRATHSAPGPRRCPSLPRCGRRATAAASSAACPLRRPLRARRPSAPSTPRAPSRSSPRCWSRPASSRRACSRRHPPRCVLPQALAQRDGPQSCAVLCPSNTHTLAASQDTATDAFFAGFYPPRTRTNQTGVKGETWSVDPYGKGTDDFTSPIDFYLIGAAWTRAG